MGTGLVGKSYGDFTIGVYPLLLDESCWFLAADFDKETWEQDALAFLKTCDAYQAPASLERSRSGNGGHVWIFFSEAVEARLSGKMGTFLLTETMDRRSEIGLRSYDRLFPSQDTMPDGGFGSLIIATGRYPGEGFDDDRLDTLFLTLPVSWRGTIVQYAGLLHRLHDRKNEVLIFDYADLDVPVLAKMHKRRLSGYRKIGYEIHDM